MIDPTKGDDDCHGVGIHDGLGHCCVLTSYICSRLTGATAGLIWWASTSQTNVSVKPGSVWNSRELASRSPKDVTDSPLTSSATPLAISEPLACRPRMPK